MRDNPLESKPKDTDKNLGMEIAKFQICLVAAKASFYPFCNPAVRIENKTEVYLSKFWLRRVIELWEEEGRTSKQIQFLKRRCKIVVYSQQHVVS